MIKTLLVPGLDGSPARNALPVQSLFVASRNDPWMRFSRATELAQVWSSDLVDLGEAGQINVAAGFGPWPAGKVLRDRLQAHTEAKPVRGRRA